MTIFKALPLASEAIDVRRLDLGGAITTGIPPAHVIREDDEEVGPSRRRRCAGQGGWRRARQDQEKQENEGGWFHHCRVALCFNGRVFSRGG
jgi:hypothetical protein